MVNIDILLEFIVDGSRLILAGTIGFIVVLLSPILIILFCIGNAVENYRKNNVIDRLYCEKCGALMGRRSFDLAKIENTKRWEEFNSKIAEAEQKRKATLADPNATPLEMMLSSSSSGTMPYYGSPRTINAVCTCGVKYVYSNNRFQMLVENQDL
ncbi:hypothetical protein [Chamaesiphon minutus]|uniref:LITAF domain-containing protein n=1 Tax=Chamaesiphon minutus (strain ATCC 27169 / PCC 6605) TaxID=1173020 RepID=K9UNE0_CHAP6|nr:hypothetical protein [Chamaesiphon minutus]AFY95951.1 hypothetical protein Cha6605_5048 [Chamaesiphon minutus PCC 6605]